MSETTDEGTQRAPSPIRITIEIDRPHLGLHAARGHMRAAVREAMLSLRDVLDAGIDTLGDGETQPETPETIAIE